MGDHNLGRFWSIGPEYTLYAPGSCQQSGANSITIFELDAHPGEKLESIDHLVFGNTKHTRDTQ